MIKLLFISASLICLFVGCEWSHNLNTTSPFSSYVGQKVYLKKSLWLRSNSPFNEFTLTRYKSIDHIELIEIGKELYIEDIYIHWNFEMGKSIHVIGTVYSDSLLRNVQYDYLWPTKGEIALLRADWESDSIQAERQFNFSMFNSR